MSIYSRSRLIKGVIHAMPSCTKSECANAKLNGMTFLIELSKVFFVFIKTVVRFLLQKSLALPLDIMMFMTRPCSLVSMSYISMNIYNKSQSMLKGHSAGGRYCCPLPKQQQNV
jgi:hypothetical protein